MSTDGGSRASGSDDTVQAVELSIIGMHCESCAALVEETLGEKPGVRSAAVDLPSGTAVVHFAPGSVGVEDLRAAIAEVGYSASPAD